MADEKADSIIEVKDDPVELEDGDFVVDKDGNLQPKRLTYDLYQQQQRQQARQAVVAGGAAVAGELGQFLVGLSVMNDPTIKAAKRDLARLEAQAQEKGPLMTEAEQRDLRDAAMQPVKNAIASSQRKADAIMASTGQTSAGAYQKVANIAVGQVANQALKVEAGIANTKVRRATERDERRQRAKDRADSIRAMMLDLRNTYIREPVHRFIGEVSKFTGTILANQPAPNIEGALREARAKGATSEQLNALLSARNQRQVDRTMSEILGTGQTADPKRVRGEGSRARQLTEEQQGIQDAADAAARTRPVPPEQDDEVVEVSPQGIGIDDPTIETPLSKEEVARRAKQQQQRGLDPKGGLPTKRIVEDSKNFSTSEYREVQSIMPDQQGSLYKKSADERYSYGYKDGVWTVYQGVVAQQPVRKAGTDEPITFTLEQAKNSKNKNVRELYDLAVSEGLISVDEPVEEQTQVNTQEPDNATPMSAEDAQKIKDLLDAAYGPN